MSIALDGSDSLVAAYSGPPNQLYHADKPSQFRYTDLCTPGLKARLRGANRSSLTRCEVGFSVSLPPLSGGCR